MAANDFAVIIGINDYPDFTQLSGPIDDASRFRDWIIDKSGGDIPDSHVKLITSEPNPPTPVQKMVDKALVAIKEQVEQGFNKEARRLYFYFSGHGFADDDDDNSLCMADWSKLYRNSAISSRGYLKYLKDIGYFSEIIFFLDCCRTRIISTRGNSPIIGAVKPALRPIPTKTLIVYAAEYQYQAYEAQTDEIDAPIIRGHFTNALLKALSGDATDRLGNITGKSVLDFLTSEVPKLANEKNQAQVMQYQTTFEVSNLVFAKRDLVVPRCHIEFKSRKGAIKLQDSSTEVVDTVDASIKTWSLDLEPGLYLITETLTNVREPIIVKPGIDEQKFEF